MHVYAGGFSKKYTNPKSIAVKKASVTLKKGGKHTVKATVEYVKPKKKPIAHVAVLRYYSSDRNVATVSAKGVIRAVGKGSCTVYVITNNGLRAKVKVK